MPHIARQAFLHGAIAILPLSLAVAPWGLLAGSMAIEANLSAWQGQGLSAIVFAGAAQLVAIGMLKGGANLASILLTTLLLTSAPAVWPVDAPGAVQPAARWRWAWAFC
jgi:predicted branched-subunit amino acid permease